VATRAELERLASRAGGRPAVPLTAVVAGAGANANIAISGLKRNDLILSVLEFAAADETGQAAVFDRTAQASIFSDGNLRVSVATNTNANRRLVVQYLSV
jgi:hypothetical protein